MVQERIEAPGFFLKSAEFAAAFVTIDERLHPSGQEPIDHCKDRQAQTIGERDKRDANQHDQAPEKLIKVFGNIKLAALANGAIIKNLLECGDSAPARATARAVQRRLVMKLKGGILLAPRTLAGDGFHKRLLHYNSVTCDGIHMRKFRDKFQT